MSGYKNLGHKQESKQKEPRYCMTADCDADMSSTPAEIHAYAKEHGVAAHILRMTGPAGGNPEVLFKGSKTALRKFAAVHSADETAAWREAQIRPRGTRPKRSAS